VFGEASLDGRVGVWSIARFGDPDESQAAYRQCLRRTVAVALHETGHMLGILHCTAYECGMNGANHLRESDAQPLDFCPECTAKVLWTCRTLSAERFARLASLAESYGLEQVPEK
jgi:archaemetzincin